MDGHKGQAQPRGIYLNGLLPNEEDSVTRVLDRERWSQAEKRVEELIACIQPNQPSEDQRNSIESYMRSLITKCFPLSGEFLLIFFIPQVLAYGSVPLQTYLPDGDIDLTAFSKNQDLKWYDILKEVLENEIEKENAEFCVKDVEIIPARVPMVKCIVENIAVDISFNQFGGLCALCFLEEVDNVIKQNHLFKHSILLIKAWCYYERCILGAQHSLISTYALETLVLYIFHAFDNSFAGPLEVLYRFLEVFSKFDWNNYYVSIWAQCPAVQFLTWLLVFDPPRRDGGELLLSESVYAYIAAYTVLPLGQRNPDFKLKCFNIIEPLLWNNNLGISVSEVNFSRILGAFSDGARQLAKLLDCPEENPIAVVDHFFRNTWDRYGKGSRPDAPIPEIDGSYSCRNNLLNVLLMLSNQHGVPSQHGKQSLTQISRTGNVSPISRTENQEVFANTTSSMSSDQNNGLQNISSYENSQTDMGRSSRSDSLRNEEHDRNLYGRPHSNSELMDVSAEVPSRHRSNNSIRGNLGHNGRRNLSTRVTARFLTFPTEDRLTSGQRWFHQSNAVANSHGASISYFGYSALGLMAFWPYIITVSYMYPLPVFPSRGSHFGIALPPAVLYGQYPNLGNGYSGIAHPPVVTPYQHDTNLVYGYPADPNLVYGYPAEHFSGVDVASHVDEDR
ncbi:hypothetical protein Dsin_012925 [Dipteronia sinensis]|uniref:Polymerase nucleotidyl transferase domain-containing protein n=1 Tax=Dipteronia sinensis TaxID=43782 RepID=A0AAE0AJU4_9ROSI|nr:hypothetical protein Dsin_012925 [Dipteronia sinensis]